LVSIDHFYFFFLYRFVVSWLDHQSAEKLIECNNVDVVKDYMRSLTEHVMSYIRYVMIHPWQIAQMLTIPVVKQNKDFFGIKMAAAMEYHKVKIGKVFQNYIIGIVMF